METHRNQRCVFLALAMVALTGCSTASVSSSFSSLFSGDGRIESVIPSPEFDEIVDFSEGGSDAFLFADGYSNGGPFSKCYFRKAAGNIADGVLSLSVYKEGEDTYAGAEYRSHRSFSYGYFATRMKAANCSGVISSFFSYTHRPVWDEIDIEILGKNMRQVQFNYYTSGVGGHEFLYDLGFDASKDFHDYGFEWLPDSITWFIDGKAIYTATKDIPSNPQQIMMNVWNCHGYDSWSGVLDPSKLPVSGQYQYIGYSPALVG